MRKKKISFVANLKFVFALCILDLVQLA